MSGRVLNTAPSFTIDSRDRISGTTSDFVFKINLDTNHRFNNIAIISAQIPKSYYLIDSTRNNATFTLTEGGSSTDVTLDDGNYNTVSFIPEMESALNAASILLGNNWIYTITFSQKTNKFTYSVLGDGSSPIFTFDPILGQSIRRLMGFSKGSINTFGPQVMGVNTLISSITVRFQATMYIQIKSPSAMQPNINNVDTTVLTSINVGNTPDGGLIEYNLIDLNDASSMLTNANSNLYTFSIYDDNDNLLNLQGQDWCMRIMMYTHNNISDLQINDLHLKYLNNPVDSSFVEKNDPTLETDRT